MRLIDDSVNKPVITTKQIVYNKMEITYIFLDEDEDWQVFADKEPTDEDIMIVSVSQILELDSSLKSIPNIEKGESLTRNNKKSFWKKN